MSRIDSTTIVLPLGGDARREQARWKARQAAYRIAAQCEHLLDELARTGQAGLSDAIGRALLATRSLVAMTADPAAVDQLFDADGIPTARLRDARRRIADAFDAPARNAADRGDVIGTAIQALRRDVDALFTQATDTASTGPLAVAATQGILIVDDEPLMITLLKRAITGMGYSPTATSSGSEALTLAAAGGIDLVLTDIEMPEMNGLELLRRLKSNEATRKIPVIVISSLDDMASVTRCIELGAEDHISKPFEPKLLTARVKASLDRKRLHDEDDRHRRDVARIIAAAEAVEDDSYTSDAIASIATRGDGLARLARVFDRMVRGLKSREDRLRHRLAHLRDEVSAARSGALTPSDAPAESSAAFAIGTVVSDRYEIRAPLGEGGMGTVYVAYDRELGVDVALKSVRADVMLEDPTMVARLKSEILLARRITHRNVVRAHDHGQWKGDHFITMELVRGITLADLLDQRGRLTPAATLSIGVQLCDALATAHETEVIHRDIKPANLLIDQDGTLKVMDFGIARSTGLDHQGITAKGFIVGTPRYMAPEVLTGGTLTAKTDLFAVGVVLFECLTGGRPFDVESPAELVAAIYKGISVSLDEIVPDVTPEFARLVQQQLAYDPAGRAASARELAQRLGEVELPDSP